MFLFLKILLVHILGDFVFQPDKWVTQKENKKIRAVSLYYHIGIHLLFLLIAFQFKITTYWLGILIIITSHYIFDIAKLYLQNKKTKRQWFFVDQFLHIVILLFVGNYYSTFTIPSEIIFSKKVLLLIISILCVTKVASVVIKQIISQWKPENKKEQNDSLAKAGNYIGVLERLFIFTFIISEHWQAIGFLLAAKSIFRFGDLTASKERKLTEYILIGTLLSFGFAILIGILYLKIIALL